MSRVRWSLRRRCASSYPLTPGSPMSSSAACGAKSNATVRALSASWAVLTVCPCIDSSRLIISAESRLSSTTSTRQAPEMAAASDSTACSSESGASCAGRVMRNSEPCPGPLLRASTCPPCSSTMPRTGEANTEAAAAGAAHLREHLEDPVAVLRIEADPRVGNREHAVITVLGYRNGHCAAGRCVAGGVVQQVRHDLRHAVGIDVQPHRMRGEHCDE